MTFHFGHKLTLGFLIFGGIMFALVYGSMSTEFELVSKDYYKEELAFQEIIDAKQNVQTLHESPRIFADGNSVVIELPREINTSSIGDGEVSFYCAADSRRDRKFQFAPGENHRQVFRSGKDILPGRYRIRVKWNHSGRDFLYESTILVS